MRVNGGPSDRVAVQAGCSGRADLKSCSPPRFNVDPAIPNYMYSRMQDACSDQIQIRVRQALVPTSDTGRNSVRACDMGTWVAQHQSPLVLWPGIYQCPVSSTYWGFPRYRCKPAVS
ncbi:hypothetical protein CENSYa_0619 [Cenarchaeum symbiosum A]|uniref:Uncharacterized protein n=1 Tax=Cenarchaeum symbiosum (strain A) TaxID=414004 RepID=A0RV85_CENSY|nr:hypothetical protein CENSYa_0619 [Cenarchaeum symbiosum A]